MPVSRTLRRAGMFSKPTLVCNYSSIKADVVKQQPQKQQQRNYQDTSVEAYTGLPTNRCTQCLQHLGRVGNEVLRQATKRLKVLQVLLRS